MNTNHTYTIAETFVGCGGGHIGFHSQGFKTIFANDIWSDALLTLKANTSIDHHKLIEGDIRKLNGDALLQQFNLDQGQLDVLMGGVVCKGFSLAGVRNPYDERNYLYKEQLRLVRQLKPKISIIENVPQFKTMKILKEKSTEEMDQRKAIIGEVYKELKSLRGKKINLNKQLIQKKHNGDDNTQEITEQIQFLDNEKRTLEQKRNQLLEELKSELYLLHDDLIKIYDDMGYNVTSKILNCADYGGFTTRRRIFIVAIDKKYDINKWVWPVQTHCKPNDKEQSELPSWNTVRAAIHPNEDSLLHYTTINNPQNDKDNIPMNHRKTTIEKFKKVKADVSSSSSFASRGTSKRLSWDKPSPTLVPGHSSFQLHPEEHRSITVREGGILSGFPSDYKFQGNHSSRCMQIGNAIPVQLSTALAKSTKQFLTDYT